jgi:hypothetical protein
MMTYFNSTDAELLATGEYPNYINYSEGIWFDQRTGELMTRDWMIWTRLNYWHQCYKQIGMVWRFDRTPHTYKYKHRNSVVQTAKLMGLHLKLVGSLNKLYARCDCEGRGVLDTARSTLGKDWKRALKNLVSKDLVKVEGDAVIINPDFILTRDNWPTKYKRQRLQDAYERSAA